MDYYAIIIKLGVLTWKDAHDASFNLKKKKKKNIIQNMIPFFSFKKRKKWKIMKEREGRKKRKEKTLGSQTHVLYIERLWKNTQ